MAHHQDIELVRPAVAAGSAGAPGHQPQRGAQPPGAALPAGAALAGRQPQCNAERDCAQPVPSLGARLPQQQPDLLCGRAGRRVHSLLSFYFSLPVPCALRAS